MGLNYFNFARNQDFQDLCLQAIYVSAHFSKVLPAILLTILMSFGILIPTSQCCCLHTYYNHICLYSSNSNILLTSEGCGFHFLIRASPSHLLWDLIPSLPPSSCTLNFSFRTDSFSFSMWTSISTHSFQQPSVLLLFFCWLCYLCLHPSTETSLSHGGQWLLDYQVQRFIFHLSSLFSSLYSMVLLYLSSLVLFTRSSSAHSVIVHVL